AFSRASSSTTLTRVVERCPLRTFSSTSPCCCTSTRLCPRARRVTSCPEACSRAAYKLPNTPAPYIRIFSFAAPSQWRPACRPTRVDVGRWRFTARPTCHASQEARSLALLRPPIKLTVQHVHRDFEAEANVGEAWFRPYHRALRAS